MLAKNITHASKYIQIHKCINHLPGDGNYRYMPHQILATVLHIFRNSSFLDVLLLKNVTIYKACETLHVARQVTDDWNKQAERYFLPDRILLTKRFCKYKFSF